MKYFIIQTDPQYHTAPEIIGWDYSIKEYLRQGVSYHISSRQLFQVRSEEDLVFTDVISFPFFIASELVRDVIKLYETDIIWKEIVLFDQRNANAQIYYLPILDYVDCLSINSKLTRDGSELIHGILDESKIGDRSIFFLESVRKLYTIARLDIVESFLRRGAVGIGLEQIQVES